MWRVTTEVYSGTTLSMVLSTSAPFFHFEMRQSLTFQAAVFTNEIAD